MMLTRIAWSKDYEIVPSIDEQHKQVLALVISLAQELEKCTDKDNCVLLGTCHTKALEWLHFLLEYTEGHMMFEEAIMEETKFPDRKWHTEAHRRISINLRQHYIDMADGKIKPTELLATLDHLTRVHIMTEDMSFKGHFLSNNIR